MSDEGIQGAETLVQPVDVRSLAFSRSKQSEEEAWTSVLPSSLEPDLTDTPTPHMRVVPDDARETVNSMQSPGQALKRRRPYGVRAGILLAAVSAVTGAALAIAVLKIRPIAPAVDPDEPPVVVGEGPAPKVVAVERAPEETPPPAKTAAPSVSIESRPDRAAVYDGTIFVGTTPLNFLLPEGGAEKQLRLEKRGYEDASVTLDASTTERVVVELRTAGAKSTKKK
jgi:hypothetical protein